MEENYPVMVSIECCVYNHEPYLRQCLDGFVMQKTNFPFEAIVHDDASTDGSAAIIMEYAEKYPDIIKPYIETENQYSKGNGILRKYLDTLMKGKYIAWCEGDDYWIDPNKLQKQVDFLENNPDYSMCFHNAVLIYDDTPKPAKIFNSIGSDGEVSLESLIDGWIVPSASMLYRNSCMPIFPVKEPVISGDWRTILHLAGCGKIWAFKDVMSVYRMTFYSSSLTSKNKNNAAFMCYQKHHILECFDEYTNYKYHDVVGKYSKFWYDYSVFTKRKNRNLLWAVLSMPIFALKQAFHKY